MSHSWTGFGFFLLGTIFHTSALVFKLERLRKYNSLEVFCCFLDCLFAWNALVSGLAVVLRPTKAISSCHAFESFVSSTTLFIWLFTFLKNSERKQFLNQQWMFFFAISIIFFMVLTTQEVERIRIGMVCFTYGTWLHLFTAVVLLKIVFSQMKRCCTRRKKTLSRVEAIMEVIKEEEDQDPSTQIFLSTKYPL